MHLREDFTTDPDRFPIPKMQELVTTLHERDQRYILILDPGIHAVGKYAPYQRGLDSDVFLKAANGSPILGVQWPGEAVWPDWFAPNTQQWWTDEIAAFFDKDTGINLDGLWVDMNEASNFCHTETCDPRGQAIRDKIPPLPPNSPRPNTGRPIPGFPASFQPGSSRSKVRSVDNHKKSIGAPKSVERRAAGSSSAVSKGFQDRDWFNPKFNINSHLGRASAQTIYFNTSNHDGSRQYDTHNLYGHMMAHATHDAMESRRPGLRPFVLTRSTFAGTGRKATHWFGDNFSSWDHYRASIRQMLAFVSMHQMPLVGSDVCGFNGDADEYMCARWAMLGAFQPFYRNHAELSTRMQEFYQWPIVAEAAKKAIDTRYKLLDYMYTALYRQSQDGTPMINPLFFLYPNDANTFGIEHQWFLGDSLLISPVTQDNSDTVTYYLPKDRFYNYWTGAVVEGQGEEVTESGVMYNEIPIHVRGGSIIPFRANSANTTKALRQQPIHLVIYPAADGTAKGSLYLDDGESIEQKSPSMVEYTYANGKLSTTGQFGYAGASGESITVEQVVVLGQDNAGAMGSFDAGSNKVTVKGPWKLSGAWHIEV